MNPSTPSWVKPCEALVGGCLPPSGHSDRSVPRRRRARLPGLASLVPAPSSLTLTSAAEPVRLPFEPQGVTAAEQMQQERRKLYRAFERTASIPPPPPPFTLPSLPIPPIREAAPRGRIGFITVVYRFTLIQDRLSTGLPLSVLLQTNPIYEAMLKSASKKSVFLHSRLHK